VTASRTTEDPPRLEEGGEGATALHYLAIGGVCGLAWAAGLRGFMSQVVVEEGSSVTWMGTFAWVLAPGVGTGLLLGWAAYLVRTGARRGRALVFAPLLFAAVLLPPILTLDFDGLFEGGVGGGTIGVPAIAIIGAYAIRGRRPWRRILCGLLALSPIPIWALTAEGIGGASLGLDEPLGLWVALYYWSFLAVLMFGCSIPLQIRTRAP
jgi:hypothetical protein